MADDERSDERAEPDDDAESGVEPIAAPEHAVEDEPGPGLADPTELTEEAPTGPVEPLPDRVESEPPLDPVRAWSGEQTVEWPLALPEERGRRSPSDPSVIFAPLAAEFAQSEGRPDVQRAESVPSRPAEDVLAESRRGRRGLRGRRHRQVDEPPAAWAAPRNEPEPAQLAEPRNRRTESMRIRELEERLAATTARLAEVESAADADRRAADEDYRQLEARLNELRADAAEALGQSEKRRADAEGRVYEMVELARERLAQTEAAERAQLEEAERREATEDELEFLRRDLRVAVTELEATRQRADLVDDQAQQAVAKADQLYSALAEELAAARTAHVGERERLNQELVAADERAAEERERLNQALAAAEERGAEERARLRQHEQQLREVLEKLDAARAAHDSERGELTQTLAAAEQRAAESAARIAELEQQVVQARETAEAERRAYVEGAQAERTFYVRAQFELEQRLSEAIERLVEAEQRIARTEAGLVQRRRTIDVRLRAIDQRLDEQAARNVALEAAVNRPRPGAGRPR